MAKAHRVLIVDDEPDIRKLLSMSLTRMDLDTEAVGTLEEARKVLKESKFDLCLTDMRLPDGDGIELVKHIQSKRADMPVAVITAYGSVETAVDALKAGAFDFVSKPLQLEELRNLVSSVLKLQAEPPDRRSRHVLLGDSEAMRGIRNVIVKLSRSQAPVFIYGESGTGKERVARLIHEKGPRSQAPFVPVNCGAIPPELMESEFFGHKKGSFTGASSDKPGLFQAANHGTLFLDEVVELPVAMQVKLLRAIQERSVRPIGANEESPIDVRILSASHQKLSDAVAKGLFRQDLYYRINVIELEVPPLRDRADDIPALIDHIMDKISNRLGQRITAVDQVYLKLKRLPYPGNVRELENILERASALSEEGLITLQELELPQASETKPRSDTDSHTPYVPGQEPLEDYLTRVEKKALLEALGRCRNNKTAAADLLGLSFRSLRYKLKKYTLD